MIKSISFILLTQCFHFNELKILRNLNFFTVYMFGYRVFFKISSFVFNRRNKFIQVWNKGE